MQVERFRLFRQDIRDLVELTVQKMDLYHMVGQRFFVKQKGIKNIKKSITYFFTVSLDWKVISVFFLGKNGP